jgi:hypothetical protein
VAVSVAVASILGTKLAVRLGTKQVVVGGLLCLAAFFAWVSTASAATSYTTILLQMLLAGTGIGLTSAPATEAIMGVVPAAKAGVGSAVNDATRLLGGTLGVAVIGSVYASLYTSRLTAALPATLQPPLAQAAHDSVGAALGVAANLSATGHPGLASGVHQAANSAFFDGLSAGCLVAGGVALAGAIFAAVLLPAQPSRPGLQTSAPAKLAGPAAALD